MIRRRLHLTLAALLLPIQGCHPPDAGRGDPLPASYLALVAAEDARPAAGVRLDLLRRGLAAPAPALRAVAARALGRLERPELIHALAPLLDDPDPGVRRETANAIAQSVHRADGGEALRVLRRAVGGEDDPAVLGALARSLGRLRVPSSEIPGVASLLVGLSRSHEGDAPPYQMEGVALGMASLAGGLRGQPLPWVLEARLEELAGYGVRAPAWDVGAARVRATVVTALLSRPVGPARIEALLQDPSWAVRRIAASRLADLDEPERNRLAVRALGDDEAAVRLEAVRRGLAGATPSNAACGLLLMTAQGDPDVAVRLAALDALASPCPARLAQADLLASLAATLEVRTTDWHAPAHALLALAALAPARAGPIVRANVDHPNSFARAWVAHAATRSSADDVLLAMSRDAHPNVRTAAIEGLARLRGRGADGVILEAMTGAEDNQLLLTAAGLLTGTEGRAEATAVALDAFERISGPRWETLRDARVALLELVRTTGGERDASRVEPYLRDFDPAVARQAAAVLLAWTGKRWVDAPRRPVALPTPTPRELDGMDRHTLVFHMTGGGVFRVRLLPWQAPTNAVRLWRMAREGTLDGLTFHRVVANFVVQGGSPGANEYAGHGAFTRDEVGLLPNWRGTVGVSTRGRDTGDGQIYLNLVDNVRLDHDYTVMGVVVEGMEVLDSVLEGDVIAAVEIRPGG